MGPLKQESLQAHDSLHMDGHLGHHLAMQVLSIRCRSTVTIGARSLKRARFLPLPGLRCPCESAPSPAPQIRSKPRARQHWRPSLRREPKEEVTP